MPLRPCLDCRRPSPTSRCASCRSAVNRERDAQRGSSTARGYDAEHKAERREWEPVVATGLVRCRRAAFGLCVADSPLIGAAEEWHLGHPDAACPAPKAPEHVVCNAGAPNRRTV